MRNLKKILALVLALVMSLSLMITANAFKDDEKISGDYAEAVEVLDGLGVFQGYEDGSFQPQGKITRAEVAAIIYRIVTGDVKDNQVAIYSDYNKFTDTNEAKWAAGYIGFCANAEYIKGYGDGKFGPNDQVTGYQALAMILRAVGYDVNGEFTGTGWQVQVASTAKKLGILENVVEGTLGTPATREVVAEILFQTITKAPQVEYTLAFGYQPVNYKGVTKTLGEETFQLVKGNRTTIDNWGRPGYQWFAYSSKTVVATIEEAYLYANNVAATQCDIAKAIGQTGTKTYDLYDNAAVKNGTQSISALATTATVGAQGQVLEVYKDRIVLIDTLLAQVVSVADATYDRNGHLATPSKITLDVFQDDTDATPAAANNTVRVSDTNGATNYGYAAGDMVLVNAHLSNDKVIADWQNYVEYIEILQVAEAVTGAQTVIWYNAGQHTVNGTTYDDAARFHLNVNTKSTANRTWYFDQFGNLIGNTEIATQYSYAVVKNMWWAADAATGTGVAKATLVYMDGTENTVTVNGVATHTHATVATPVYSGYTTGINQDMKFGSVGTTSVLYVASNAYTNAVADGSDGIIMDNLFRVETATDGSVKLVEVADELDNAEIISKYAVISGTGDKAASGDNDVLVNANTKFLVYNTSTQAFSVVDGFNAIDSFTQNPAIVDYVESNGYAKYAYVIGKPDTATTYNFVMPQSINYSAQLSNNGISYYVITIVNVGGEVTSLNVKTADFNTVLNTLTAGVNKLFYVTFTGSYATAVTEVTGIGQNFTGMAANQRISLLADDATNANVVVRTGNDLAYGPYHFNVTEATEIVGTLPEGRQTAKNVYVLHNSADNVALKIWVVAGTDANTGVNAPMITALTVSVNQGVSSGAYVDSVVFSATATNSNVAGALSFAGSVTATPTWQKLNPVTGVYENYSGDAFVAGTYRAVVSLTVNNAVGQYYTISNAAAISYYGQAGKVGASFVTDPILVP